MKNITEMFDDTRSISQLVNENQIDEGLKDLLKIVKEKFKKAFSYLKGLVVKVGSYFLPVDNEGDIMPAITPMTSGQAYKDGLIDKTSTFVALGKDESKIVGYKANLKDAKKLYGPGNSIQYWDRILNESLLDDETPINEVKIANEDPEAKYNIIVDDEELKDEIRFTIEDPSLARLLIWGAPGIGKTAILNNVLTEYEQFKGYNLIIKTLSQETPDNFTLPKYVVMDGQDKATDVPKTWMPVYKPTGDAAKDAELDEKCGKGLLFIDELSRATPQVLNVILPLINEGVFNGYKLGSGWTIICASNRMEDEAPGGGSQTRIGNALANRFRQIHYEPTYKTWKKWAEKQNYISPLLLQWLSLPESENMSGGKFFYWDPNSGDGDNDSTIFATPRGWTNAMYDLSRRAQVADLEGFKLLDIPKHIIARSLNKCIPASAVDTFLAFLEVVSKIGNFDQAVYDVWKNGGKNMKIDKKNLNLIMIPISQLVCTAHSESLPSQEEFENFANWLISQNSASLASYALDVFKTVFAGMIESDRQKDLIFSIHKVVAANPELKDGYKKIYTTFTNKWKIDFDDIPDYSIALKSLAKKYGADFKAAVIDGIELLG